MTNISSNSRSMHTQQQILIHKYQYILYLVNTYIQQYRTSIFVIKTLLLIPASTHTIPTTIANISIILYDAPTKYHIILVPLYDQLWYSYVYMGISRK